MLFAGWVLLGLHFISPFCVASEVSDSQDKGEIVLFNLTLYHDNTTTTEPTEDEPSKGYFSSLSHMLWEMEIYGSLLSAYGNWCGMGPYDSHPLPVDPIDECCRNHDFCYGSAHSGPCRCYNSLGRMKYKFTFDNETKTVECDEKDHCKFSVCYCDYAFGLCVLNKAEFYNISNGGYDWFRYVWYPNGTVRTFPDPDPDCDRWEHDG